MLKFGHNMTLTYKDLESFGIKNLNLSIDKKIFDIMCLICEDEIDKNRYLTNEFKQKIHDIKKKRKSKIIVIKTHLDLIFFLNNNEINNISHEKIEIIYRCYDDLYNVLAMVSILRNYIGNVVIYPIFNNKMLLSKDLLLLLLSDKKVCFCKSHTFVNTLPEFQDITKDNVINMNIYNEKIKQINHDIKYVSSNSKYEKNNISKNNENFRIKQTIFY